MIATNQTAHYQAQLFLYDLRNKAQEYWFKPDEDWEISLVTVADKTAIEKKYCPTVSAELQPELLVEVLDIVKSSLKQTKSGIEMLFNTETIRLNAIQYLIAYNFKRQRT